MIFDGVSKFVKFSFQGVELAFVFFALGITFAAVRRSSILGRLVQVRIRGTFVDRLTKWVAAWRRSRSGWFVAGNEVVGRLGGACYCYLRFSRVSNSLENHWSKPQATQREGQTNPWPRRNPRNTRRTCPKTSSMTTSNRASSPRSICGLLWRVGPHIGGLIAFAHEKDCGLLRLAQIGKLEVKLRFVVRGTWSRGNENSFFVARRRSRLSRNIGRSWQIGLISHRALELEDSISPFRDLGG